MTRRPGTSRTTDSGGENDPVVDRFPSLRERNPFAYWFAIFCVAMLVLGTVAGALGAIL